MKCFRLAMFRWWFGWSGYGAKKWRKNILFHYIYIVFFLNTVTDDLKIMTYNYIYRH